MRNGGRKLPVPLQRIGNALAGVAKPVDAGDLKSPGLRPMWVRVPPPAPGLLGFSTNNHPGLGSWLGRSSARGSGGVERLPNLGVMPLRLAVAADVDEVAVWQEAVRVSSGLRQSRG